LRQQRTSGPAANKRVRTPRGPKQVRRGALSAAHMRCFRHFVTRHGMAALPSAERFRSQYSSELRRPSTPSLLQVRCQDVSLTSANEPSAFLQFSNRGSESQHYLPHQVSRSDFSFSLRAAFCLTNADDLLLYLKNCNPKPKLRSCLPQRVHELFQTQMSKSASEVRLGVSCVHL
jgi:hypothetical protein